jgi:hypothetical protein
MLEEKILRIKKLLAGMGEYLAGIGSLVMKFYVFVIFWFPDDFSGQAIEGLILETFRNLPLFTLKYPSFKMAVIQK